VLQQCTKTESHNSEFATNQLTQYLRGRRTNFISDTKFSVPNYADNSTGKYETFLT